MTTTTNQANALADRLLEQIKTEVTPRQKRAVEDAAYEVIRSLEKIQEQTNNALAKLQGDWAWSILTGISGQSGASGTIQASASSLVASATRMVVLLEETVHNGREVEG